MGERTYGISYNVESGQFTKEYLKEHDLGGCDNIIIHSIMQHSDGSRSEVILDRDEQGKPLDPVELFKSWVHLAHILSEDTNLSEPKRDLCRLLFEHVRSAILSVREKKEPESATRPQTQ